MTRQTTFGAAIAATVAATVVLVVLGGRGRLGRVIGSSSPARS